MSLATWKCIGGRAEPKALLAGKRYQHDHLAHPSRCCQKFWAALVNPSTCAWLGTLRHFVGRGFYFPLLEAFR